MKKPKKNTANSATYEATRELARHEDPKVRCKVAARKDIKPEILFYLADDPSPDVRAEIARNPATPIQADLLLADDTSQSVREGLALKLAGRLPDLSKEEQEKVSQLTSDAMRILARDQITHVRQVLAEALKDVAHAPADVINRLARDAELSVCKPVLEFSPVLTDDDLLDIISSDLVKGALGAISRRAHVSEVVVDAVVDKDDTEAISDLLANSNTQIREETLDKIISKAPNRKSWHKPLSVRPEMPPRAAFRLASFIADHLLNEVIRRNDLDVKEVNAVREEVRKRLGKDVRKLTNTGLSPKSAANTDKLSKEIAALQKAGKLGEAELKIRIKNGETEFIIAALSHLSNIPRDGVKKMISVQSRKGLVAVVWKAGLSMKLAADLQQTLLDIPRKAILKGRTLKEFPLSDELMEWQLDFLTRL
ncbi:MAG: DUF2336 domain-containing protein [Rhodospirillaceae bacterium]|nr:DUF2336 domain-containing protein [Rhodospirillales bacterium]MBT3905012.1 DUF2336 domain-containing protein [Rhodospirillaceae bacterium]MBT4702711.1 DUF2336 domain-containing protein [Rhodospirillaceae bacterium]MBT5034667.1 DUF2336 domain-containing protein [Rhodospirillaceae bacterium]MBT6218273.1 DUF2336 domain-containing protein [Rhodospirillaceae bacterium]